MFVRFVPIALCLLTATQQVGCRGRPNPGGVTAGVGDRLQPFIIVNANSGQRYCQVCAYGGRPTVMAVFDLDAPSTDDDLRLLERLVKTHADDGLTAFALFGTFTGARVGAPKDPGAAQATLRNRAEKLGLTYPLTTLPEALTPSEALHYKPFDTRFKISRSRTVFVASADNRIRSSVRMDQNGAHSKVEDAVRELF